MMNRTLEWLRGVERDVTRTFRKEDFATHFKGAKAVAIPEARLHEEVRILFDDPNAGYIVVDIRWVDATNKCITTTCRVKRVDDNCYHSFRNGSLEASAARQIVHIEVRTSTRKLLAVPSLHPVSSYSRGKLACVLNFPCW